jgi:23S rRNA (guanine2445-N2)-methyltransferase / 23S rRNA (guanine2069-N7)-methyltransferase
MTHRFVATTARGLEAPLLDELRELGLQDLEGGHGAVRFSGPLAAGYRACMGSRIAGRILLQLAEVASANGDALYEGARAVRWQEHLGGRSTFLVRFSGVNAEIRHPHYGAMRIKDAVCDALRMVEGTRPDIDRDHPDVVIYAHLDGDVATLGIDLSGDPLHLRGRDRDGGPAPLRETLAAGILRMSGWASLCREGALLIDPMCGSGTLVIEAADVLRDRAPGLRRRHWGFSRWRGHDAATWAAVVQEAQDRLRPAGGMRVFASDRDREQIERTTQNLERAGMVGEVKVQRCDLSKVVAPRSGRTEVPYGLMVTNPPYGVRLGEDEEVFATWQTLGDVLRRRFLGWEAWILAGEPEPAKRLGLRPRGRFVVFNGPLEARVLRVPIASTPVERDRVPAP